MVLGLLALALVATGPTPGPEQVATRYRVDMTLQQQIDLSAAGQGVQSNDLSASIFMNVVMSDTTDGQIAHVVIDSMTLNAEGLAAAQYSQQLADSIRGSFIHAYIVDGRLKGAPTLSVEGNVALVLATQSLSALFPGVGTAAAGKAGWADTVTTTTSTEAVNVNSTQVITWTRTGQDGDVLLLSGTGEGTVTGEQQGNQVSGTVKNTLTAETVIGGPARSARIASDQAMDILVASLPDPVSVKTTTTVTAATLP